MNTVSQSTQGHVDDAPPTYEIAIGAPTYGEAIGGAAGKCI